MSGQAGDRPLISKKLGASRIRIINRCGAAAGKLSVNQALEKALKQLTPNRSSMRSTIDPALAARRAFPTCLGMSFVEGFAEAQVFICNATSLSREHARTGLLM